MYAEQLTGGTVVVRNHPVVMLPWALPLPLLAVTCFSSARGQTSDYPLCESGLEHLIGNGGCSDINNTEECGWDGGDCCECDCVDGSWECGTLGYKCLDSDSLCYEDLTTGDDFYDSGDDFYDSGDDFYDSGDDFYDSGDDFFDDSAYDDYPFCYGSPAVIGSGSCTTVNNNEECDWDGGDCCECDCIPDSFDCGSAGYDCQNPASACYEGDGFYDSDDDVYSEYPLCNGSPSLIGSGACTPRNNNEECGWDGGDCCECDCVSYTADCSLSSFYCQDPGSTCYEGFGETNDFAEGDDSFPWLIVSSCVAGGLVLLVIMGWLFKTGSLETCACCSASESAVAADNLKTIPGRDAAPLSPPPAYKSPPRGSSAVDKEYVSAQAPSASTNLPHPAYPVSPPPAYDDSPRAPPPTGAPQNHTIAAPPAATAPPAPESSGYLATLPAVY